MLAAKERVEAVTVALRPEQRARLDREAIRRSAVAGRLVTRSAVARDLLDRALDAGGDHDDRRAA